MRFRGVFCGFVVILMSVVAVAQEVDSTMVFPIAARTTGVGTSRWVTDLTVHNLLDQSLVVGLQFFPADQTNSLDLGFPDRITLGRRNTAVLEDVLSSVFGYHNNIKGVLLVTVAPDFIASNPEDAEIVAVTRTYNAADPAGTYGQTVPSLLSASAVTAGPLVATGARNDSSFRSNVGFVNISVFNPSTVHYRVLSGNGTVLASGVRVIPTLTVTQWSLQQLGVGAVDGPLTVELWLDPASVSSDPCDDYANRLLGYVSKVDNGTGDAEFIYAAPTDPYNCNN